MDICYGEASGDDGLPREKSAAARSGYQWPGGIVSSIPVVSLGNESDDSSENTIRQIDETQWFSANDCDQIERWRPQPQEEQQRDADESACCHSMKQTGINNIQPVRDIDNRTSVGKHVDDVIKKRGELYGAPFVNHKRTAEGLRWYFAGRSFDSLTAADIPAINIIQKLSRSINRFNQDDWLDIAGYCDNELEIQSILEKQKNGV